MISPPGATPNEPNTHPDTVRQGREFIAQVQRKIDRLVQDYASGQVNRAQFQRLYARYQRQIATVNHLLANAEPNHWRDAIFETEDTLKLKKRLTATPLGVSLYESRTGQHIQTVGEFDVDYRVIAPMLYSYRSAASEVFRAGARSTELETGEWLCFLPGRHTTLIALFSLQPSDEQLETIQRMHEDFEVANHGALQAGYFESAQLAYPFYALMQRRAHS